MIEDGAQVAGNSTGLESRHMSRYFVLRMGKRVALGRFPKVSVVCDTRTHLFLAAKVTRGPRHDMCEGPAMLRQAGRRLQIGTVLLDAGYDAEKTHVLVREVLGAESIIPAKTGRGTSRPPTGKYRRMMHDAFPKKQYGQRWQVESAISRDKRLFGSAVRATSAGPETRGLPEHPGSQPPDPLTRLPDTFQQSRDDSTARLAKATRSAPPAAP